MTGSDWKFGPKILPGGRTVAVLTEKSKSTQTAVQCDAPILENEVRQANAIVRDNPDIKVTELRLALPILSNYASDRHLIELIRSYGEMSPRDVANRLLADPTGLDVSTIEWYRTHRPRQIKSSKRGRPRKT